MFTTERVKKRPEQKTERPDFSDTTDTALAAATYFLLENPEALQKLAREIRNRFKNEDDITIQSTTEFPLLGAVVQDSCASSLSVPQCSIGLFPQEAAWHAASSLAGPLPSEYISCGQTV